MNELQAGIEFSFAVFPEPAALFQPTEGTFDDPAFRQHGKGMQFIALDDLDGGFQTLRYAIGEGLAGVAAIDQHAFNSLQIRPAAVDGLQGPAAVGYLGSGNRDGMGQALRIHPDVPFHAGDLLACVVALVFSAVGVLHALRVNDQEAGHDVAPKFGAGLANRFFLSPAPERCYRPGRARSTWRSTNAPCATWEIHREACATGSRS